MANAKPKSSGGGIVDLSNDKAWQARLEEARARRAQVLKDADHGEARRSARTSPWDEADTEEGDVDFHDRMNRFKKLAGIEKAPERTQEELDRIDRLLTGRQKTLRMERSRPLGAEAPANTPGPRKPVAPATEEPSERPPVLTLTDENLLTEASAQAENSETDTKANAADKPRRRRWFAGWVPFTSLCLCAGALFVAVQGAAVMVYFWDSTPPELQSSMSSLPLVVLDDLGFGAMAPDGAADGPSAAEPGLPKLTVPSADTSINSQTPAPRPFASL